MAKKKSAAAVARGKKMHSAQKKLANALYKKSKSKFDKMAISWCKKPRANKKRKSKKTGKMVSYNIFFQFRDAVIKAGGNNVLAQMLWKKHCGKFHPKPAAKKPAKKTSTRKTSTRKTSSKKTSSKKTSSKKTSSKKTSSKKTAVKSGPAFNKAGKQLKKLKPKIKISGKSYDTLAKRKAAIAKAKAKK